MSEIVVTRMPYEDDPAPDGYVWTRQPEAVPSNLRSQGARALCCLSCGALVSMVDLHSALHRREDTR